MKRGVLIAFLLTIPAAVSEAADLKGILDKIPLRHKWHVQCNATACQYKSSYKPPAPFGAKNEAVMTVEVLPLKQKNLDIILKSETADIRKTFEIDEEASEEDGKSSNRGIAIWKENFDGAEAGFIRYRARSEKAPPPHFFTTTQGTGTEGFCELGFTNLPRAAVEEFIGAFFRLEAMHEIVYGRKQGDESAFSGEELAGIGVAGSYEPVLPIEVFRQKLEGDGTSPGNYHAAADFAEAHQLPFRDVLPIFLARVSRDIEADDVEGVQQAAAVFQGRKLWMLDDGMKGRVFAKLKGWLDGDKDVNIIMGIVRHYGLSERAAKSAEIHEAAIEWAKRNYNHPVDARSMSVHHLLTAFSVPAERLQRSDAQDLGRKALRYLMDVNYFSALETANVFGLSDEVIRDPEIEGKINAAIIDVIQKGAFGGSPNTLHTLRQTAAMWRKGPEIFKTPVYQRAITERLLDMLAPKMDIPRTSVEMYFSARTAEELEAVRKFFGLPEETIRTKVLDALIRLAECESEESVGEFKERFAGYIDPAFYSTERYTSAVERGRGNFARWRDEIEALQDLADEDI